MIFYFNRKAFFTIDISIFFCFFFFFFFILGVGGFMVIYDNAFTNKGK